MPAASARHLITRLCAVMSPPTRLATVVDDFIFRSTKRSKSPVVQRNEFDPGQPSAGSDALLSRFYAPPKFTQFRWGSRALKHVAYQFSETVPDNQVRVTSCFLLLHHLVNICHGVSELRDRRSVSNTTVFTPSTFKKGLRGFAGCFRCVSCW